MERKTIVIGTLVVMAYVGPKLEPGASDSFKIGINTAGSEVTRTEVQADAHPVERS